MESQNHMTKENEVHTSEVNDVGIAECVQPTLTLREGPLLVDSKTAAAMISVGISTFYAMDRSGELGPPGLRLRRRRLWPREELAAWVRAGCPPRPRWLASREGQKRGLT